MVRTRMPGGVTCGTTRGCGPAGPRAALGRRRALRAVGPCRKRNTACSHSIPANACRIIGLILTDTGGSHRLIERVGLASTLIDDLIELSAEGIARRSTTEPQADHGGRACAHIDLVVRGGLGPGLARVDGALPAPHDAVVDPVFDIRRCVGRPE